MRYTTYVCYVCPVERLQLHQRFVLLPATLLTTYLVQPTIPSSRCDIKTAFLLLAVLPSIAPVSD